ncbi:hypothetical protein TWF481_006597 [Arthrobotrys musiformis]|uniref:Uncharacterized protein n=1 Tax=Arthrobotrys musiformis TaxID=47236 RepID=A0AAV9W945_9PEZI
MLPSSKKRHPYHGSGGTFAMAAAKQQASNPSPPKQQPYYGSAAPFSKSIALRKSSEHESGLTQKPSMGNIYETTRIPQPMRYIRPSISSPDIKQMRRIEEHEAKVERKKRGIIRRILSYPTISPSAARKAKEFDRDADTDTNYEPNFDCGSQVSTLQEYVITRELRACAATAVKGQKFKGKAKGKGGKGVLELDPVVRKASLAVCHHALHRRDLSLSHAVRALKYLAGEERNTILEFAKRIIENGGGNDDDFEEAKVHESNMRYILDKIGITYWDGRQGGPLRSGDFWSDEDRKWETRKFCGLVWYASKVFNNEIDISAETIPDYAVRASCCNKVFPSDATMLSPYFIERWDVRDGIRKYLNQLFDKQFWERVAPLLWVVHTAEPLADKQQTTPIRDIHLPEESEEDVGPPPAYSDSPEELGELDFERGDAAIGRALTCDDAKELMPNSRARASGVGGLNLGFGFIDDIDARTRFSPAGGDTGAGQASYTPTNPKTYPRGMKIVMVQVGPSEFAIYRVYKESEYSDYLTFRNAIDHTADFKRLHLEDADLREFCRMESCWGHQEQTSMKDLVRRVAILGGNGRLSGEVRFMYACLEAGIEMAYTTIAGAWLGIADELGSVPSLRSRGQSVTRGAPEGISKKSFKKWSGDQPLPCAKVNLDERVSAGIWSYFGFRVFDVMYEPNPLSVEFLSSAVAAPFKRWVSFELPDKWQLEQDTYPWEEGCRKIQAFRRGQKVFTNVDEEALEPISARWKQVLLERVEMDRRDILRTLYGEEYAGLKLDELSDRRDEGWYGPLGGGDTGSLAMLGDVFGWKRGKKGTTVGKKDRMRILDVEAVGYEGRETWEKVLARGLMRRVYE